MLTPEQKFSLNDVAIEIFEYDNGSVAFLNPESLAWVRSSSTGLWIFQCLKENPSSFSQTVNAVANYYGLPPAVVEESTIGFLEEMISSHFLTSQDSDQKERLSTVSKVVELSESGLRELSLDVTSLCHGSCQHCYKPRNDTYHFPVGDLEELLLQAKTLGVANLIITGGEPLLHPEFSGIMRLAGTTSDWIIKVITGGQGSSSEIVDALMENADIVQVSLDGLDKDTNDGIRGEGAFKCAVTLLKWLHGHKNRHTRSIGISFTPLSQNIEQMAEVDESAYALGIDFIHFNHLKRPASLSRDIPNHYKLYSQDLLRKCLRSFDGLIVKIWNESPDVRFRGIRPVSLDQSFVVYYDLFNLVKKHNCGAGVTTLSITEKGDVYPCAALQAFSETYLGNWIRERDLPELYSRARRWNKSVFSVDACDQCKACHFRYLCGGGCRARGDSLAGADTMCEVIRESYHEFFEFVQLLPQKLIDEELLGKISEGKVKTNDNDKQGKRQFKPKQCT